ncbi:MAG: DUF4013 domain-containing protein [Chloroflexota bacterium]|nr:DUF4013 domain-containing protein [Dehalococcoidia bacterium]MDW8253545.1 DUF4013 domain-containing protein [Chloroflexota bacterium]
MNIGKAFSYVFEDPQWLQKVLVGALFQLLSLVLIGIPFVLGYNVEIIRNVHRGNPNPLPEWTNLGEKFTEGLKLFVVFVVWALPLIVLYCCQIVVSFGVTGVAGGGGRQAADALGALAGVISLAFSCLMGLYALFLFIMRPAIVVQYVRTSEIGAALRFGDVFGILRRIPAPVVITALLGIVTGIIAYLGVIACFIGIFVTFAYAYYVNGHLEGQVWQELERAPAV